MEQIPNFEDFLDEGFAYVEDPFRSGEPIWSHSVHVVGKPVVRIVAEIDSMKDLHTATVSVYTTSLDNFGEDLAGKERFIIHQEDFNERGKAIKYLLGVKKQIEYK
jgi:hypothetical protein